MLDEFRGGASTMVILRTTITNLNELPNQESFWNRR